MPLMKAVKILVHALILNTPLLAEGLSMNTKVGRGVNSIAKTTNKIFLATGLCVCMCCSVVYAFKPAVHLHICI